MTSRLLILLLALSVGVVEAYAQHEGHQMPNVTAPAPSNPACAEAGRKALAIVEAAGSTAADFERASAEAQAHLFTCRAAVPERSAAAAATPRPTPGMNHLTMAMATSAPALKPATPAPKRGDPMAGMDHSTMGVAQPRRAAKPMEPGARSAVPMAGMDHSKMAVRKPAPAAAATKPAAKPADPMTGMDHSTIAMGTPAPAPPAPQLGAKRADLMAGMDHSKMAAAGAPPTAGGDPAPAPGAAKLPMNMAERLADPSCPDTVGLAGAPKAVYERKVYYFCSASARDEFRKNPAAYLKKHPR